MGFKELPPEIIDRILDYVDPPDIRALRYLSQGWDDSARMRLFRRITFTPTDANEFEIRTEIARILKARSHPHFLGLFSRKPDPKVYTNYHRLATCVQIVNQERLRHFVRKVVVKSTPISGLYSSWEDSEGDLIGILEDWKERDQTYEPYYKCLRGIGKLSGLEHVHVQFLPFCAHMFQPKVESFYHRRKILECVFESLQKHVLSKDESMGQVRALTIENLRHQAEPQITNSKAFQNCLNGIEELNLTIAQSGYGLDDEGIDFWSTNLFNFMPHLTRYWLSPVSQHLKSLSLCFDTYWGPIPGFFDTSDLEFPYLENLTLGLFVLAHDDALDWVLRSKSLLSLQLRLCPILAEICIAEGDDKSWKLRSHDWRQMMSDLVVYRYDQTWSYFLDRICNELPVLQEFGLQFAMDKKDRRRTMERFFEPQSIMASLRGHAYVQFDRNRIADESDYWSKFDRSLPTYEAEEDHITDGDALERLLATVQERGGVGTGDPDAKKRWSKSVGEKKAQRLDTGAEKSDSGLRPVPVKDEY